MQMKGLVHCLEHGKHSTGCLSAVGHCHYLCTLRELFMSLGLSFLNKQHLPHWTIEWFSMKSYTRSTQSNTSHLARTKNVKQVLL